MSNKITNEKNSKTDKRAINLVDLLIYRAIHQAEQRAFTFLQDGETEAGWLTYQELDRQARAIASALQSCHRQGERALLLYPSGLDFIAAFFGCLYAGIVAVPAYPPKRNHKMSRLEAIIADAEATVVLSTTSVLEKTKHRLVQNSQNSKLHWLATDSISPELASHWEKPNLSGDSLAFLQYTSGSTGMPKGVMVTHSNLLHNSNLIHQCFEHTSHTHGVIWLPLYNDMGLIGGVLQPLYGGFPVTLMPPALFLRNPFRWLQAISRYKATTSGGPNFAYDLCLKRIKPEQLDHLDLSSWEVAFSGAESVRAQTLEQFATTFAPCGFRREAFYPCYGLAEATLIVSGGLKSSPPVIRQVQEPALKQNRMVAAASEGKGVRAIVGCGGNLDDQKIVIVDPESLTRCPDERVGEIWVSGPSVAQGYWNRTQETEQTFGAYVPDTGEGPFLRTGDLGFWQDGELFITGRLKDVIIIRGQNHYPQDIELTVEESHPALRPGCGAAFAVETKGEERLVVVHEVEQSYLRKLDVEEVVRSIRKAVTGEHDLQVYATVLVKTGSIPKTSSGKIQRHACRTGFITGSLNVVEDWSENPQFKVKFMHLKSDIESLILKLSTFKQLSR